MSLSDTDRKAYELYLLATNDEERNEAIKKLIPGSQLYYQLYFIDRVKKVGANLSDDDKKVLDQWKQKHQYDPEIQKLDAKLELLAYDQATTEEEKKHILNSIQGKFIALNFEYYKPEEISRIGGSSESQDSESDTEVNAFGKQRFETKLDYERYFSKAIIKSHFAEYKDNEHQSLQSLQGMPKGWDHKVDFGSYNTNAVYQFASTSGNTRIASIQNTTLFQTLANYCREEYKKSAHWLISQSLSNNFTLKQLDRLSDLYPEIKKDKVFIGSYFQKVFHDELSQENKDASSTEEKRANLLTLYNYACTNKMPDSLRAPLLIEILELGTKLNLFEEKLFRDYLAIPLVSPVNVFKNHKTRNADNHWNQYIQGVQSADMNSNQWDKAQQELISKYLHHFCQQNKTLENFKDEFDSNFLKVIEDKIAVLNADDLTNLSVDIKQYQEISSEVICRFTESNKETFKVDEEVSLTVELKNIQSLYLKIFEFNTETYYKKTLQPFNTGVNLDGLIASDEKVFEYTYPSNRKFTETFKIPELIGKIGLFIVEFIGNGMSSRAVIKKGSLSLIHKPTIAGHLAYILDENKKICTGSKTGLYFDGSYFEANPDQGGKIFIPYGIRLQGKAILMNNGFAQLSDFERQSEEYTFSAWIHINEETILVGNKAQVMVKPLLQINNKNASLEILKNSKITLITTNYIDSLPITKTFDNVKFINNQEFIVDFQVPPYLDSISVQINTEVFNVSQKVNKSFTQSKNFTISTHKSTLNTCEIFLRKEKGNYVVLLLGKNGEPKGNVQVHVNLIHQYLSLRGGSEQGQKVTLKTDKDGKVHLGSLPKVMGIMVNVPLFSVEQVFLTLLSDQQNFMYLNAIDIIENETIDFPVLFRKLTKRHVTLVKHSKGIALEDLFKSIEFEQVEGRDFNKIFIKGLKDGEYILSLHDLNKEIRIVVNKGQYWDNDNFILKRTCLFENKAQSRMVKMASVRVEEGKEVGYQDVKIRLEDYSRDVRVHIIAQQFIPNLAIQPFLWLYKNLGLNISKTVFPFAMWKNIFLSNRELSDEFRYVFDRKLADRFLGNTLERPRLVLKRHYVQTTRINAENMRAGQNFQQQQVQEIQQQHQQMAMPSYSMMNSIQPIQQNVQRHRLSSSNKGPAAYEMEYAAPRAGRGESKHFSLDMLVNEISSKSEMMKIVEFQNFLKNSPFVKYNMTPNENGEIAISANLGAYTQLSVLVIDTNSTAFKMIDLDSFPIQKRDLSLTVPLNTEQGFTESRITKELKAGDVHTIEDISSTEIQLIDDMKKAFGVLEEIRRVKGTSDKAFTDLSPVFTKWSSLNEEDKHKHYTKFFSHELNIFLSFKDPEYFDKFAKPFISFKMEKTFIDRYLLGDYSSLLKFNSLEKIDYLNALEKCLLVDALKKTVNDEGAKKVANYISLLADTSENKDVNGNNNIFDIVLNLNMQKGDRGDLKMLASMPVGGGGMNGPALDSTNPMSYTETISSRVQPRMALNRAQPRHELENLAMDECYIGDYNGGAFGSSNSYVPQYQEQARKVKVNFSEIQQTSEYCETHYYKHTTGLPNSDKLLYTENLFWADLAQYLATKDSSSLPFLSANFIKTAQYPRNALMVFIFFDLPEEAKSHQYKTNEARGVEIGASGNLILFKKEVKEAKIDIKNDIMVIHRYTAADGSNISDSAIPDEFLTNKPYTCEVIMTNVSPKKKEFSMLFQIPQGSLPLQLTKYMKSTQIVQQPYTTDKLKFHFYFPKEGTFTHFPANVSINEEITAKAPVNILNVVSRLSVSKKETFRDILAGGSREDILEFLRTSNLLKGEKGFSFNDLLWMLKDKQFFLSVVQTLRERNIYNYQVWQFCFFHKEDEQTIREFLNLNRHFLYQHDLGCDFNTKLVTVTSQDIDFKHLDYFPMINARAHQVGDTQQWSLNETYKATYQRFLKVLATKKELSSFDKMNFSYYLLIQDRISEAISLFESVHLSECDQSLRIQYDYMNAYFDFFTGQAENFKIARTIVREYEDYPNSSWRLLFLEILDQLKEVDGDFDQEDIDFDPDNLTDEQRKQKLKQSIKKEPNLTVEVLQEQQLIQLEIANMKAIVLKFYIIDAEILFSRTPFLKENTEEFSYVKPCYIIEKEFQVADLNTSIDTVATVLQGPQKLEIEIPEHLKNQNMVIEVNGDGRQIFKTYYSTQIKVNLLEAYGELKVTDKNGTPLPKVYVKVFYQKVGQSTSQAIFFKDGYSDIRGKFEYAQTSSNKIKEVQRFSILVTSDHLGSVIRECYPPKSTATTSSQPQVNDSIEEPLYRQVKQERMFAKAANWKKLK